MTSNSLTGNEEHDIPSQILQTIFNCMPQLFLYPNMSISSTFVGYFDPPLILNSSGQLRELIVYIIPPE